MTKRIVALLFSLSVFAAPAFAANKRFTGNTAGATGNWNVSGNWDGSGLPGSVDQARITNVLSGAGVFTVTGAVSGTTLDFFDVGAVPEDPGFSNAQTNQVIFGGSTTGNSWTSLFGVRNRQTGVIVVTNQSNLIFGQASDFITFTNGGNIFIKRGSTLTLSSNRGHANNGTITLDSVLASGAGSTITLDYSATASFTNLGTIVKLGGSGGVIRGSNSTVGSRFFINTGTLDVREGTLIVNPGNAFTESGFRNSGTIMIADNATFIIDRIAQSWDANAPNVIGGTVLMLGDNAEWTTRAAGSASTTRSNNFTGSVIGAGFLNLRVINDSGTLWASNGTLRVLNLISSGASAGGTFRAGTALGGGTLVIQANTGNGNTISGSIIATNGGVIAFTAATTLSGTAQLGGLAANDRGTLLSSNNITVFLNNSSFLQNNGTLMIAGGGGINYGQVGDLTNNFVMTGVGSFTGVFGNNSNYIINKGTIAAVQGGVLTLDARNAFSGGGFSNTSVGTVVINNASTLAIVRSNGAWNGSSPIKNVGTIVINNGTLETWERVNATQTLDPSRFMRNDGTIIAEGQGTSTNRINASLENLGTIFITNDTAVLNVAGTTAFTNAAAGRIILGGLNASGNLQMTNSGRLVNSGLIQGQGTITLGVDANGSNASLTNRGQIVATNYGGSAQGTLTLNTGNAFSNGGLLNTSEGQITVGTNTTLVFNRTANAWNNLGASAVRVFSNQGTIFLQGGTFASSSDGVLDPARTNLNTGLITGWGNFRMLISNEVNAQVLADARGIENRNQGTLTVSLISFTNNVGSTIGAVGTNSTLNVILPSGGALVNYGTVQFSGGNVVIQGGGVISNYFAIAGVGDLSTLPVVQAGANSSLIAKTPTDGLTALIATVDPTNTSLLGAVDAGGAAELQLAVSGGGNALVNRGRMTIEGGTISIGGGSGIISNDAGGLFYGRGTNANVIATSASSSKIMASNGLLQVGLSNNRNTGSLENFGATDRLVLTNSILDNQGGTIKANNGTITLRNGGIVTNAGTISGSGTYDSSLVNASGGLILANGGFMNLGTASANVSNAAGGTIRITGGTLNMIAAAWNNAGFITNATGGVLERTGLGGILTNSGLIVNSGSIGLQVVNSGNISNAGGTVVLSLTNQASGFVRTSQGSFTGNTFHNAGTFVASNTTAGATSTNFINGTIGRNAGTLIATSGGIILMTNLTENFVNQGRILLENTAGNLAFDIRRTGGSGDFTNDTAGLIQGAGFFKTADFASGGQNFSQWNKGWILATNGALVFQPGDAFANGGFVNTASGVITTALSSTFAIQRSDNAWGSSLTIPRNEGTIQINGGSVTLYGSGLALANDRSISNAATGRIQGNGTISAGIINVGTLDLNNTGTLRVNADKTAAGDNVWGIKNLGTIVVRTNNTLVLNRLSADWVANEGLNNSGTLRMQGGVYQSAVAGTIALATNLVAANGGIYGHGTFQSALDTQGGTLSAELGTLSIGGPVVNNSGGAVTFQAIGAGNVLEFTRGGTFSSGSSLLANSGGTLQFVGQTNSTLRGILNNTGGSMVLTGSHTLFMSNVANRVNSGTLVISAVGGGAGVNYGGVGGAYTNLAGSTVRTTTGSGSLTGVFDANNHSFVNEGTLRAGAGSTLTIDPRAATGNAGFSNASTGRIFVENGANFIITRTTAAWTDDNILKNEGTISLDGGTFATYNNAGTSPTILNRIVQNNGWVEGFGFFRSSLTNFGVVNVSGGTLSVSRLHNQVGGIINIDAGSTLTNTDLTAPGWVNRGTLNVSGTLSANGTFENRGDINIIGNTGTLLATGQLRNFGNIVGQNANVNFVGFTNNQTGAAMISNSVVNVTETMRNLGALTLYNSTGNFVNVQNVSGATMLISNNVSGASKTRLNVTGVFTNAGRVEFFRSVGTFASGAVNSGLWITDPTTNVFHDTFTVTSAGNIIATAGDVFHFTTNNTGGSGVASFVNQSSSNELWSTQNAALNTSTTGDANIGTKFLFEGDGTQQTQNFFHAGLTLTGGFIGIPSSVTDTQTVSSFSGVAGFSTNFALGTLELTNTFVKLSDTFGTVSADDGKLGGLFVKNLFISSDSTLIISNNMRVYFINSNSWSLANITLLGNAEIHQLTLPEQLAVVPEPTVVFLWLSGFATLYAARRRDRKRRQP